MPAPRQIVSLVTLFEISQRKSLGYRASPAVLSLTVSLEQRLGPTVRVLSDAILFVQTTTKRV